MIDCFLSLGLECARPLRAGLALATVARWAEEVAAGRVRLMVLDWGAPERFWRMIEEWDLSRHVHDRHAMAAEGSQRMRHALAAALTESDVYAVVDSDLLLMRHLSVRDEGMPEPPSIVEYLAQLVRDRPEYAMISPLPQPGGMWPGRDAQNDGHVWRTQTCGGIRFVRRGAVDPSALPPMEPDPDGSPGYDGTLGRWIESRGLACGYAVRAMCVHLGYGSSVVWRGSHEIPGA